MIVRRLPTLAVMSWLIAAGGAAWADDSRPSPDQERDDARTRFERGTELFDEGNLDGALVEFEASFALRPVAVVMFNIAQTQKLLLRYADAIASYRRYLEIGGPSLPPDRIAEVRTTIARLQRSTGTMVIDCAPAGARVLLDGRLMGQTPLDPLVVAAGSRRLEVRASGRAPLLREIQLSAGAVSRVCARLPLAAAAVDPRPAGRERDGTAGSREPDGARGGSILGRWWFWGVAAVVVAGGVTAAVLLSAPGDPEPVDGNASPPWIGAAF